jgi:hypothetical protein
MAHLDRPDETRAISSNCTNRSLEVLRMVDAKKKSGWALNNLAKAGCAGVPR